MLQLDEISEFILPIFSVIGGCCSNAYALELIASSASDCGTLLTISQFASVVLMELPNNLNSNLSQGILKKRTVPLTWWAFSVILFFGSSLLNNIAFKFDIPVPLHIVFRSGSMFANMLLGYIFLKKSYKKMQVFAVLVVTIGIILATLGSTESKSSANESFSPNSDLLIGIIILIIAMFMGAALGIVQERTYKRFGKGCWREGLFYTHFLSLPCFLIFSSSITKQLQTFMRSESINILNISVPSLMIYLIVNCLTQLFCVSGVQRLSSLSSSLTLNLILTIRKMLSIIFSVYYFKKDVTSGFAVGTSMVLLGTLIYTNASSKKPNIKHKTKEQ